MAAWRALGKVGGGGCARFIGNRVEAVIFMPWKRIKRAVSARWRRLEVVEANFGVLRMRKDGAVWPGGGSIFASIPSISFFGEGKRIEKEQIERFVRVLVGPAFASMGLRDRDRRFLALGRGCVMSGWPDIVRTVREGDYGDGQGVAGASLQSAPRPPHRGHLLGTLGARVCWVDEPTS